MTIFKQGDKIRSDLTGNIGEIYDIKKREDLPNATLMGKELFCQMDDGTIEILFEWEAEKIYGQE